MKTASLWGPPPTRFYRFLRLLESELSLGQRRIAVLGCADGKFVLPAARRGYDVLAIDVDRIALFGGTKEDQSGTVRIPGLASRLLSEGLDKGVTIRCGDFVALRPECDLSPAVLTSGSIQYSLNMPRTAEELLNAALGYVAPGGFFYIDYMLPYEDKYKGRPNCPDWSWWQSTLDRLTGWRILHHRWGRPVLDPPHVEFASPHFHQWGHALLRRDGVLV